MLGSLGAVTGRDMASDTFLPDWFEQGVESSLRDAEEDLPPAPMSLSSMQTAGLAPRSIASSNRGTPVVLTPTGPSPSGSYVRQESGKSPWANLDKFYDETGGDEEEEGEESEEESEEDEEEEGEEGEGEDDNGEDETGTGAEEEPEISEEDEEEDDDEHQPLHKI